MEMLRTAYYGYYTIEARSTPEGKSRNRRMHEMLENINSTIGFVCNNLEILRYKVLILK